MNACQRHFCSRRLSRSSSYIYAFYSPWGSLEFLFLQFCWLTSQWFYFKYQTYIFSFILFKKQLSYEKKMTCKSLFSQIEPRFNKEWPQMNNLIRFEKKNYHILRFQIGLQNFREKITAISTWWNISIYSYVTIMTDLLLTLLSYCRFLLTPNFENFVLVTTVKRLTVHV